MGPVPMDLAPFLSATAVSETTVAEIILDSRPGCKGHKARRQLQNAAIMTGAALAAEVSRDFEEHRRRAETIA